MEEWRDIEGFEELYQVSNMGRVKSLNYNHTGKEKILKLMDNGQGYQRVKLCRDGKVKLYYVHRLVASAFCENPMGYNEVNHIDENPKNNKTDNLEWCNRLYNCNYGTRNQRVTKKRSKPVIGINKASGIILEFPSAKEASRQIGISRGSICNCIKGRQKSAGGYIWQYL